MLVDLHKTMAAPNFVLCIKFSMHKDPVVCKTTLLCMGESFSYSLHRESNKNYNLVRVNRFISF